MFKLSAGTWLRLAVACGGLPVVLGVAIFAVWLLTRWSWLMSAGVLVLMGGPAVVLVGAACLVIYVLKALRAEGSNRRAVLWRSVVAAGLLAVNFPAAVAIVAASVEIETAYTVTVLNASATEVQHFAVHGGGVRVDFGAIPPSRKAKRSFHIRQDGQLDYAAVIQGRRVEGTIAGYVTPGLGGRAHVTIQPDLQVQVQER